MYGSGSRVLGQGWQNTKLDKRAFTDMGAPFQDVGFSILASFMGNSANMLTGCLLQAWKKGLPTLNEVEMPKR